MLCVYPYWMILIVIIVIIDVNINNSSCHCSWKADYHYNSGLNIANCGINFIPRLDSVPESTIKTNLGIKYVLNLIHLARMINSLIGGKSLSKHTKWQTYCFTNMQKKVPTARNWPLPTNRWRTSQQNGLTESQSNN